MLDFDFDTIAAHLKVIAYLNKGLHVQFQSQWHAEARAGDIQRSYYFDGGLSSLVRSVNRRRKVLQDKPFYMLKNVDGTIVEAAIQYKRRLQRVRPLLRQLHQHRGGRHPSDGLFGRP